MPNSVLQMAISKAEWSEYVLKQFKILQAKVNNYSFSFSHNFPSAHTLVFISHAKEALDSFFFFFFF